MKLWNRIEDIFAAVAFAEEGDAGTARVIMAEGKTTGMHTSDDCYGGVCDDAVSRPA